MFLRKRGPKIVISGYYGFDNCGDEAILYAIVHCLKLLISGVRIIVLSGNPDKTLAMYGVKAIDRWNPFKVARALFACPLFISGGGSLIQDVTGTKSPRYYLAVIWLANLLAKKTMIYGQGLGPLTDVKIRDLTAKVLAKCDVLTVRDARSAELLREIGLSNPVDIEADPVLALSYEDTDRNEILPLLRDMDILDSSGKKSKPLFLVTVRCWQDNRHLEPLARLLDTQAARGWDVLLAPMHFPADMEAIDRLSNLMTERLYCLGTGLNARQFLALTAYADKVLSMRLHGLIFAMAMGIPMLALSYDPKVDAFMEQAGLSACCLQFEDFNSEAAQFLLDEMEARPLATLNNQEKLRLDLSIKAWNLAKKAASLI